MRFLVIVVLGVLLLGVLPGSAAVDEFPVYNGDQFNELFTTAPLDGLAPMGDPPSITGDETVDSRMRAIAEKRGYVRRPIADASLVAVGNGLAQRDAARAWNRLRSAAREAGHSVWVTSGFRGVGTQRSIFLRELGGYSDSAIDARLRWVALPGYSKHHTGYALDIAQPGYSRGNFANSPAFAWLSANNNQNAKRFGFIPSYPPDAGPQGPEPEPWEWTYVGVDTVRCGAFNLGYQSGLESANPTGTAHDLATCPDLALSRGAVAFYLSAALELPEAVGVDTFKDDDGSVYEAAIEQINQAGITSGCGEPTSERFCPKSYVSRGQIAVFLVRALGIPETSSDMFVDDDGSAYEDAINRSAAVGITTGCNPPANDRFCPDQRVTRSELLGFLKAGVDIGPPPLVFEDVDDSVFEKDIQWLADHGITAGCNPPENDRFCPGDPVSRGEMAAFLTRALALPPALGEWFSDDDASVFEEDIERVAAVGITLGCNPPENDRFCPGSPITRGEMAAFLTRGLELSPAPNPFQDSIDDLFREEIGALHGAGITKGCNPPVNDLYCPGSRITRGEMAALLHRGLDG